MKSFETVQEEHWNAVRNGRFYWATKHSFVSEKEKKLLSQLSAANGNSILEVGCGEGPNLANISNKYDKSGVDYSQELIAFSRKNIRDASFYCQDATNLQFPDDSFDIVFCRDLIHHLRNRSKLISEMYRVCKPGGSVFLIESNGWNPIINVFSYIIKSEQDVRRITPNYMSHLLEKYDVTSWKYSEPLSLWRFLFHYRFGLPRLAIYRSVSLLYGCLDKLFHLIIPKKMWGYMIVQFCKPSSPNRNQNNPREDTTNAN